jgi:excisionase family DNA binding protein
MAEPILYNRQDAAAALGISTRAIDYFVSTGRIRVRRFGKRVLIPREELERLAAKDQPCIVPDSGRKE